MDQTLVASIRKDLDAKSTEELRQAYASGNQAGKPAEELEAIRQILDERGRIRTRTVLALSSAAVVGVLAGAFAGWQGFPPGMIAFAGVGGAALGFASWYVPDLIPQSY
jgi:small-conductance mechanosensitive channel